MSDFRVPAEPFLEAFGVPAVVTRPVPDATPITTTVMWVADPLADGQAYGTDFHRGDPRRILALVRSVVPTVPRGTVIVAAEAAGESSKTWVIDGLDRALTDQWRVFVKQQN